MRHLLLSALLVTVTGCGPHTKPEDPGTCGGGSAGSSCRNGSTERAPTASAETVAAPKTSGESGNTHPVQEQQQVSALVTIRLRFKKCDHSPRRPAPALLRRGHIRPPAGVHRKRLVLCPRPAGCPSTGPGSTPPSESREMPEPDAGV